MRNNKTTIITTFGLTIFLLLASIVSAGTISLSLGSYDTEIYKQETVNIPVTVTSTNITGTVNVVLTPKSGLSCSTCTLSASFSGGTNEQQTVTFTLTGTQSGTYNPPFVSIGASSGSTQATPISSGSTISVSEKPTWTKDFEASDTTINVDEQITLTLTVTPSGGSFSGVTADLVLPSGITLVSGNDPKNIGTVSGETSSQWIVKATSAGTKNVQVRLSSTSPQESASSNTETISITVSSTTPEEDIPAGGAGGAGGGGGSGEILNFGNITTSATMQIDNVNYSITELSVNVNSLVANAKVFITKKTSSNLDSTIPRINGTIYQYLVLSSSQITDDNIESGEIKFRVDNQWITDKSLDKDRIFLLRYNGNNWIEEPLTLLYSDTEYTYYKAKIEYLGTFGIAYLPPVSLDYIKMASLKPELIDLKMVIESGLADSVMIDRLEAYFFGKLDLQKTISDSQKLAETLDVKREVVNQENSSRMTVTIKNRNSNTVSFMFVEAVPKSIVHDVYALKDFDPRKYDLIIREDPIIQWSFGEADTSIVAWEIKDLKPDETATFSYSLDARVDLLKYPAPIIVKASLVSDTVEAAGEENNALENSGILTKKGISQFSAWLSLLFLLAIIGVIISMYLRNRGYKHKSAESATHHEHHETPHHSHFENEHHDDIHDKKISKISEYISHQKAHGKDEEEIKRNLKKVGWDDDTINKAFEKHKR